MVQLLLDGLKGSAIQVFQVDGRSSDEALRWTQVFAVLKSCVQAIWLRVTRGADHFYYVPSSGNRARLYLDWLVMLVCRPFFKRVIFHWHSGGLGEWLEKKAKPWERWVSARLIGAPDLSVIS